MTRPSIKNIQVTNLLLRHSLSQRGKPRAGKIDHQTTIGNVLGHQTCLSTNTINTKIS